ncbi:MAG: hypothetical protein CMP06_05620 [Xanthomonadales bacterium]|nr:hypothetical protein [Xanthomonadales bacterium]
MRLRVLSALGVLAVLSGCTTMKDAWGEATYDIEPIVSDVASRSIVMPVAVDAVRDTRLRISVEDLQPEKTCYEYNGEERCSERDAWKHVKTLAANPGYSYAPGAERLRAEWSLTEVGDLDLDSGKLHGLRHLRFEREIDHTAKVLRWRLAPQSVSAVQGLHALGVDLLVVRLQSLQCPDCPTHKLSVRTGEPSGPKLSSADAFEAKLAEFENDPMLLFSGGIKWHEMPHDFQRLEQVGGLVMIDPLTGDLLASCEYVHESGFRGQRRPIGDIIAGRSDPSNPSVKSWNDEPEEDQRVVLKALFEQRLEETFDSQCGALIRSVRPSAE